MGKIKNLFSAVFIKRTHLFLSMLICVAVLSSLLICISCKQEPKTYKIGAIYHLTGPASSMGEVFKRGAELAISDLNCEKIQFALVIEDGKSDPNVSISALRKLQQQNVKVVHTFMSSVSMALVPIADNEKIVIFADAAHPQITANKKYVFRHSNTADQEANVLWNYIVAKLNVTRIAVLYVNDDYGLAFVKHLDSIANYNKPKISIIQSLTFASNQTDFTDIAVKINKAKPEVVIIAGYGKALGLVINRLRIYKYKGDILTSIGFVATQDAITSAGKYAKGVYFNDLDLRKDDSIFVKVKQQYSQKYGSEMPTSAMLAYNSIRFIAKAIESVGYDTDKIASYIKNLGEYYLPGENVVITKQGDIQPLLAVRRY
ncbi:MAG: ABC transporter substrate-binding protein [candidate division WOR-3 bacterium]